MDLPFLQSTFLRLIQGLPLTLQLSFLSVTIGLFFALLLGFAMRSRFLPLAWFARTYVFVFRGTPLLVQLFLIYYGSGSSGRSCRSWTSGGSSAARSIACCWRSR